MPWIARIAGLVYVRDEIEGKPISFSCGKDEAKAKRILRILKKKKAAIKAREAELRLRNLYKEGK